MRNFTCEPLSTHGLFAYFFISFLLREKPVRTHLKNVYACLALTGLAAAVGSAIHMMTSLFQVSRF